jgi:hypothetical protein
MKSPRLRTLIILTAAMVGAIWIGISLTAGPPWQRSIVDTVGSKGAVESPLSPKAAAVTAEGHKGAFSGDLVRLAHTNRRGVDGRKRGANHNNRGNRGGI